MNTILEWEYPGMHNMRDELLGYLTDDELAYKLPGDTLTLGELCMEMGNTQQVYSHSFQAFVLDWDYRGIPLENPDSVAGLQEWYAKLDTAMENALQVLSEEDIQNLQVDRGYGFSPSLFIQFQIYHEAVLIFCAKASIYLKALQKTLSDDWKRAIG